MGCYISGIRAVEMVGKNDDAIVVALEAMAQRENPSVFNGMYDPDCALTWLKEIKRIFHVMDCISEQKARYRTHMLVVKVDEWWLKTRQRFETTGEEITWAVFRREFLRKYYPEDVCGNKEIEFLKLKQGSMLVIVYAAKFGELAKFYQHYDGPTDEFLK
ncbi:uncharacterized protein LOC131636211 [Vicia villosa]|uniref:uncharacterized protein LOC131636211 n=1 Tax=Vicia villosa TaxID=3911 RepID=UPI00273BED5A|nr:uncharacterized protein LOC131636211 [Vicia villosa]